LLGQFLSFLAQDIATHPERLKVLNAGFLNRIDAIVAGIEVDLNESLPADDE